MIDKQGLLKEKMSVKSLKGFQAIATLRVTTNTLRVYISTLSDYNQLKLWGNSTFYHNDFSLFIIYNGHFILLTNESVYCVLIVIYLTDFHCI